MIKVKAVSKNELFQIIEISGHAGFAPKGEDLVCAGVSSIVFGTLNALDQMCADSVDLEVSKTIKMHVKNLLDETCQIILKTMMIQLKTIEEQHYEYIEIKQEVSS